MMQSETLQAYANGDEQTLNEYESRAVLAEYGIPCPTEVLLEYEPGKTGAEYFEECAALADRPDFPVYVKAVTPDISSVSDAGGVQRAATKDEFLEVTEDVIENVVDSDPAARIDGVLVSEDVGGEDTREVLLGAVDDPEFGHVISLGVGGVFVELYGDMAFRTVPVTERDVTSMIDDLDGNALFDEFRGMPPVDIESVTDTACSLSRLLEENPEISEVDINPLIASSRGVVAADALIVLSD